MAKKDWKVDFFSWHEELIESVTFYNYEDDQELENAIQDRISKNRARLYKKEEVKPRWIKSKIAVVLGINNQYAGMCIVNNQDELDKIKGEYDFPYLVEVIEDIPSLEDFLASRKKS